MKNILKYVQNILIPRSIQRWMITYFCYARYLIYRFKIWEHPKVLKLVYIFFITLSVVVLITMSLVLAFGVIILLLIAPLSSQNKNRASEEYKNMYDYYPYNAYGEESSFCCSGSDDDD